MTAGHGKILGAMDTGRRIQANAYGNQQVKDNEPDQHNNTVDWKKG